MQRAPEWRGNKGESERRERKGKMLKKVRVGLSALGGRRDVQRELMGVRGGNDERANGKVKSSS